MKGIYTFGKEPPLKAMVNMPCSSIACFELATTALVREGESVSAEEKMWRGTGDSVMITEDTRHSTSRSG